MKIAMRIGYNRYYCDENFNEHIEFIKKNIATIDEITLFAEFCHYGYWDEAFTQKNTEVLKRRIREYKKAGVKSVGINILNTRGHTHDGWEVLPKTELQHIVYSGGGEDLSCLCFSNEAFDAYITKRYAAYAKTGADFIWLDDDLSPGGGRSGCMCNGCIEKFNKAYGYTFCREDLVKKRGEDTVVKKAWESFNGERLKHLVSLLAKTVRDTAPNVKVGFMSIDDSYESVQACKAEMCRPGGGFYDERKPIDVFAKGISTQAQVLSYPDFVNDIQYEYEAFNYQTLDKSLHISELETTLALMNGCNGALYNNDIFYDRQGFLDMLAGSKKKWAALTERTQGLGFAGVFCRGSAMGTLMQIGIPLTLDLDNAVCCFVDGAAWNLFEDEMVKKIIHKGVMTDGRGLEILTERGFGAYLGGSVKQAYASSMAERFANHPLCGAYQNHYRDTFMNFTYYIENSGNAYELAPAAGAETVSNLETITHEKLGCSLYVYEGENRFAVDGYFFPNSAKTHAKKAQITNVLDWISHGKLPVRTPETIKLIPAVRADAQGNMTVMLTNASLDHTGKFEFEVRSGKELFVIGQDGQLEPVAQRKEGGSILVTVDNIDRWDYILLTNMQ